MKFKCYYTILLLLFFGCSRQPDLSEIKQPVFGNLTLGENMFVFLKKQDSLRNVGDITYTSFTQFPYFKINTKDFLYNKFLFLFPSAQYNHDSIITKVHFFVYMVMFSSAEVVEGANAEEMQVHIRFAENNQKMLSHLVNEFALSQKRDRKYDFSLPNYPQIDNNSELEGDIIKFLTEKYGSSYTTNIVGDQYDPYDHYFAKEVIWKTDLLKITFLQRRFEPLNTFKSRDFFYTLTYEYNDTIVEKYQLHPKKKDLTKTF
jgi:hypothetical protein